MRPDRYILFLGDSYCSSLNVRDYLEKEYSNDPAKNRLQTWKDVDCHPSLVAEHYGLRLLAHGYAGKSWWYSRSQFESQLQKHPDLLNKIEAMVFFHTDWARINTDALEARLPSNTHRGLFNFGNNDIAQAQNLWFKYLYDENYQQWSMQNWFREISTRFNDKKQVHFHSFADTIKYNDLLIGQKFITPLVWISIGESTETTQQLLDKLATVDTRANHLSSRNNFVLADIIIQALDNYQNQSQELDLSKFEIYNPNYKNFPHGNFGIE